ncbi:MAG TPA: ParB/RepB/Spo0J family partition protein [Steroidobacteraceae bacterium]|jgi:ParB family chromosome partitioning protein|nr:ParB/RepB/Spo0J family partition protein [Steroidobacteraceae bacterium]
MTQESKGGLGRGLGALLGAEPRASASRGGGTLPISLMQSSQLQPRREIHREPLEELAASIKAKGVIQPIVVRPLPAGSAGPARYEIVAGERRWQAAKLAGLSDIPVIVRQLSDQEAVAVALIENIQREELTAAEEARSLKRLTLEFSLTHQEVADSIGRSRAAVSNLMRLLDLPESVVALIDSKVLGMGHARALLGLPDEGERERLAKWVAERGLSVRETESLVRKSLSDGATASAKRREISLVSEVLRTSSVQVQLHQRTSGAGKIVVEFANPHARDELLNLIRSFEE